MIHNLIIATESGVKLFEKQFMTPVGNSSNMLASLLTAVLVKGKRELFHTMEYFEMQRVALTIVNDGSRRLFCAVITDSDVGNEFPKLIATQTLQKYIEESTKLQQSTQQTLYQTSNIPIPGERKIQNQIGTKSDVLTQNTLPNYQTHDSFGYSRMEPSSYFTGQRVFPSLSSKNGKEITLYPRIRFNGMVSEEEIKSEEPFQLRVDPYVFQVKLRETFLSIVHSILNECKLSTTEFNNNRQIQ